MSPPAPVAPKAPAPSAYVPTEEWTWRLLEKGFNLEEAASIRGLDRTSIIRHATLMARQGKPIDLDRLIGPETSSRWTQWRTDHGDAAPPPDDLDSKELWTLFVATAKRR